MGVFLRILFFAIIILAGLYFWNPNLFKLNNYFSTPEKIDVKQYILTPDPSTLFLEGLKISTSKAYDFNGIASATDLYFQAVKLFQINILTLLDQSNNKAVILKTHLTQLHHTLDALDNTISSLTSLYTQEEATANMYLQQKEQGDSMFNQGFVEHDSKTIANGLKTSHKNGPKYMEHRIIANAAKIVVSKLQNIRQLLYLKVNLLETHENEIITNFSLIKGNILPQLLKLKRKLENNNYY